MGVDELYPVYYAEEDLSKYDWLPTKEVPLELLLRYKKVHTEFDEVQNELDRIYRKNNE
mgnify:CR=1 FL=1